MRDCFSTYALESAIIYAMAIYAWGPTECGVFLNYFSDLTRGKTEEEHRRGLESFYLYSDGFLD